jgi:hypothetical protein
MGLTTLAEGEYVKRSSGALPVLPCIAGAVAGQIFAATLPVPAMALPVRGFPNSLLPAVLADPKCFC